MSRLSKRLSSYALRLLPAAVTAAIWWLLPLGQLERYLTSAVVCAILGWATIVYDPALQTMCAEKRHTWPASYIDPPPEPLAARLWTFATLVVFSLASASFESLLIGLPFVVFGGFRPPTIAWLAALWCGMASFWLATWFSGFKKLCAA